MLSAKKVKKYLAFVLASVMLAGLFTVSASAEVSNPNAEDTQYAFNLLEELGANAYLAAQVRYNLKMDEGPQQYGWGGGVFFTTSEDSHGKQAEFDQSGTAAGKGAGGSFTVSSSRVEFKSKTPFFTEADIFEDEDGQQLSVSFAIWGMQDTWGAKASVLSHEFRDVDGNVLSFASFEEAAAEEATDEEATEEEAAADEEATEEEATEEEATDEEAVEEAVEEEAVEEEAVEEVVEEEPVVEEPTLVVVEEPSFVAEPTPVVIVEEPAPAPAPAVVDDGSPFPVGATVTVANCTQLNVRSGHGVSHGAFTFVSAGDVFTVLEYYKNGWVKIETAKGAGWVYGGYLSR